jgi:uncharacterized repeat protein (TIGR02543 family)
MKKFAQEVVTYFWIPLIMALVSYIFFQLRDVILGIIVLVGLSAVYTLVRLYFIHKKWWIFIILMVVVFASVGAYFLRAPALSLTINDQKVTGVNVSLNSGTISVSPAPGNSGLYTKGTKVTLTANPAAGSDWLSWQGTDDDAANPTTVTMSEDKKIQVNFESRFSMVINNQLVIGSYLQFAEGSVSVNPPPEGDGKYTNGTEVILSAKSASGYDWKGWLGTTADASNPTKVIMSGNKNITVTFNQRFSLTVSNQLVISPVVTFPEGSVTVSPGPDDDGEYAYGTKITLTANPNTGYGWKYWSGTANDTSNPATVTINSNKHVAVTFEVRYLVTINSQVLAGSSASFAGGSVTADPPPGIDSRYAKDAIILLKATASTGYRFDKWSGDVSDKVTSVSLPMNANKNITVTFIKTYVLTTGLSPAQGGTISPAGGVYDDGASVTLTATPAAGYRFDKWSGAVSDNVTLTNITMTTDKTVTANFIKVFTLTVTVSPADSGTISPNGGTYDTGTEVTLTATPATGFAFDHWSGDISGNVTSTNVTMDAARNITANFIMSP